MSGKNTIGSWLASIADVSTGREPMPTKSKGRSISGSGECWRHRFGDLEEEYPVRKHFIGVTIGTLALKLICVNVSACLINTMIWSEQHDK